MRNRKTVFLILAAVGFAAVLALLLWLRKAPPRPARILPEADGYFYLDLRPMRAAGLFDHLPEIQLDPEYQQFVQQTGIQIERDLDQAAFAVHLPRETKNAETRFSEVFVGRFDLERLRAFLKNTAAHTQQYRDQTVFEVPLPGRTVRAAMLDSRGVAVSNASDPEAIQHILNSQAAWFGRGPSLLRTYYPEVPFASPLWAVLRATSVNDNPTLTLPGGLRIAVPEGTVLVASLRYTGEVQFRAEAFAPTPEAAERLASRLGAYLTVLRTIRSRVEVAGLGPEFQKFLDSIQVEKQNNRVVLTASASPKLLQEVLAPTEQKGPTTKPK
jgi:hypothetical protein